MPSQCRSMAQNVGKWSCRNWHEDAFVVDVWEGLVVSSGQRLSLTRIKSLKVFVCVSLIPISHVFEQRASMKQKKEMYVDGNTHRICSVSYFHSMIYLEVLHFNWMESLHQYEAFSIISACRSHFLILIGQNLFWHEGLQYLHKISQVVINPCPANWNRLSWILSWVLHTAPGQVL